MCFFSPIRNDPKKTHKQIFGTHPVPGQSRKFVYVYVFFFPWFVKFLVNCRHRIWPGEGSTVQWKWSPPAPGSLEALLFPPLLQNKGRKGYERGTARNFLHSFPLSGTPVVQSYWAWKLIGKSIWNLKSAMGKIWWNSGGGFSTPSPKLLEITEHSPTLGDWFFTTTGADAPAAQHR